MKRIQEQKNYWPHILFILSFVFGVIVSLRFPFWEIDWDLLGYRADPVSYFTERFYPISEYHYAEYSGHVQWFRPLSTLFYVGLYPLFGYNTILYHGVKALMLAFFSVILYKTLLLIFKDNTSALLTSALITFSHYSATATYQIWELEIVVLAFMITAVYFMAKSIESKSSKWLVLVPVFTLLSVWTKETGRIVPLLLSAFILLKRKEMSKKIFQGCVFVTLISVFLSVFPEFLPNLFLRGRIELGQFWYQSGTFIGKISFNLSDIFGMASLRSATLLIMLPSPLILMFFLSIRPRRRILVSLFIASFLAVLFPLTWFEISPKFRFLACFGGWTFVISVMLRGLYEKRILLMSWLMGAFVVFSVYQNVPYKLDMMLPVVVPFMCIMLIPRVKSKTKFSILTIVLLSSTFVIQLVEINNQYARYDDRAVVLNEVRGWMYKNLSNESGVLYQSGTLTDDFRNFRGGAEILTMYSFKYDVELMLDTYLSNFSEVYLLNSPGSGSSLDEYVSDHKDSLERIKLFGVKGIDFNLDPLKAIYRGVLYRRMEHKYEVLRVVTESVGG